MVIARTALRAAVEAGADLEGILSSVNRAVHRDSEAGVFLSFILAAWDAGKGILRYAGAGHEHILIYRGSWGECSATQTGGMILGVMERAALNAGEIPLEPGDAIALYTDGYTEAVAADGEMFGLKRLQESFKNHGRLDASGIVRNITEDVKRFTGPAEQRDDMTLLVIKRR